MNALTLAWHITKKDIRSLNGPLYGWIGASWLLAFAQTLLRTVWPPLAVTVDARTAEWLEPLGTVLPTVRLLFFAVIVAGLVHADPLVSTDAFWLTRPISRRVLFLSKLLSMLLVLALPAALVQIAPMIAYGVPTLDMMWLLAENLLCFVAGLTAVFAAAALTPNSRSLTAWALGLFILWAGTAILMSGAPVERRSPDGARVMREMRTPRPISPDQLAASLMLLAAGCGVIVWHQYRTRARGQSAAIAALTAGAVLVAPYVWPDGALDARPALMDHSATPLGSGIRFQDGPRSVVMWPAGEPDGMCRVMVRVTQVQGIWSAAGYPSPPSYRFVYRPTRKNLAFTYFALPNRSRELAPLASVAASERLEVFQVSYRDVFVGPTFASNDPRDTTLRGVSCSDVDVIVRD